MNAGLITREIDTKLGPMLAGACARGVCLLEFGAPQRRERALRELELLLEPEDTTGGKPESHLAQLERELGAYFAGELPDFSVPVHAPGTAFQRRVWARMRRIPCGRTLSYGRLAERIGSPGAARAVGAASGRNRIAILIPCHRVVESTGALRGYGGGLKTKQWLLEHERAMTGQGVLFVSPSSPNRLSGTVPCTSTGSAPDARRVSTIARMSSGKGAVKTIG